MATIIKFTEYTWFNRQVIVHWQVHCILVNGFIDLKLIFADLCHILRFLHICLLFVATFFLVTRPRGTFFVSKAPIGQEIVVEPIKSTVLFQPDWAASFLF